MREEKSVEYIAEVAAFVTGDILFRRSRTGAKSCNGDKQEIPPDIGIKIRDI